MLKEFIGKVGKGNLEKELDPVEKFPSSDLICGPGRQGKDIGDVKFNSDGDGMGRYR